MYIVNSTQKNKSQEITSMTTNPNISPTFYKRIAYIEIALYTIIALYLLQRFLLKYYVEEINTNKGIYSKNPSGLVSTGIAGGSIVNLFNSFIYERFKGIFKLFSSMFDNMFGSMGNIMDGHIKSLNSIRNFMKPMRDFIKDATLYFYKKLEGFIMMIMYTFHRLRQTMRRSLSTFNLLFHSLEHTKNLILSILDSSTLKFVFNNADKMLWVGNKLGSLCFNNKTPIKLDNNNSIFIENIKCGDKLYNNNIVTSTLHFLNNESIYSIYSNELQTDILVSGSHIIYDTLNKNWTTVDKYHLSKKTEFTPAKLYCISTLNHKINIGELCFSDYEEISDNDDLTYKLNHYILCGLNYGLSAIENLFFCESTKHMDSGLSKNTLVHMKDDSWKKIQDISIGDELYKKGKVLGITNILSNVHNWYIWNNIVCTDTTKVYDDKLSIWRLIKSYDNIKSIEVSDDIGFQLITDIGEFEISNIDNSGIYKIVDFIQIHDKNIQEKIEKYGITYLNKKFKIN
jgi:hypothetical protein